MEHLVLFMGLFPIWDHMQDVSDNEVISNEIIDALVCVFEKKYVYYITFYCLVSTRWREGFVLVPHKVLFSTLS